MKTLQVKLVFWGPGCSGKTTMLRAVAKLYKDMVAAGPVEVSTSEGRTMWEDYLALHVSSSIDLVVHVYTTTGQRRFLHTREYVASGADAILFVADSQREAFEENIRSWEELKSTVPPEVPVLVAANKQDLPSAATASEVAGLLEVDAGSVYPTVALDGWGVGVAFRELLRAALKRYVRG
ncbi:MAG: ADP-ribosylation factor-like protein [Candidatus Jordarchaeales archaeon]